MRTLYKLLFACILASGSVASAQTSPNPVDIGLQSYHDYHGGDIDHVNIDNGNLTLTIPLVSYPQRGSELKLDFNVIYNGTGRNYYKFCVSGPPTTPPPPPTCSYIWGGSSLPYADMSLTPTGVSESPALFDTQDLIQSTNIIPEPGADPPANFYQFVFNTADGGSHAAGQTSTGQISLDGSGFQAGFVEGGPQNLTTTCTWDCSLPSIIPSPGQVATNGGITWISSGTSPETARIDSDGNYIVNNGAAIVDTTNRSVPLPVANTSPTGAQTAQCTGPLAITSISVWNPPGYSEPFTFCYVSVTLTIGEITNSGAYLETHPTETMLQSIVLPNGQTWTFEYNESLSNCPPSASYTTNVGDLTQITFPTGGTINYAYECIVPLQASPYEHTTAVRSRTVNANDGTGPHTWSYSYGSGIAGNTTMTDPAGNDTVDTVTATSRVSTQYSGTGSGRTQMRKNSQAFNGNYTGPSGYPMYPSTTTVTLENGISTQTSFQYCCDLTYSYVLGTRGSVAGDFFPTAASNGKVTDAKVYDYTTGTLGTLLKETQSAYLFQSNTNYLNPGFFDLKTSETVYDGNSNEMAQTTYGYDQTARVTSGIASLTGSNMTTPLYSVYGHQTTKTAWLNTGPSNPASTVSYYDTGEPYIGTDPLGHTTKTYFCTGSSPTTLPCTASTYVGALPTVISNALGQQTSFAYIIATGQKQSVTDPNSQTTTYTYADPMNRLTNIAYPDLGNTAIQYNDMGNIGVTVTQKITASLNKQTQAIVDGLGRLSQTILLSDPSGPTYTQTSYDEMGRKYQVWNPTRCVPSATPCSGETTWGITTYNYDALSRETLLIPPDGTATTDNQKTSYTVNTVTLTDEAGKVRTTTSDALGRLTQVSEGTEAYITAYTYDALSNLTCVEQHGGVTGTGCSSPPADDASSPWRVRRFTYDSLSRLLTAKNPETGTITYGYNADSVLTTKTDNRGMTVTYTPEPLHRVSTMVYSDSTPTVTNTYDAYVSGTNYGIGRRTGMSDGSGSTTFTYDKMGRIWTEQQTIGTLTKSTSNVYNLDGSVAQTTYPSGAVIAITPGGDGRPPSETDTTHSIDYAKSLVYAPPGEVSTALYGYSGSYAGITQTNSYNSRGQPVRLQACGLASCTDGSGSPTPYLMDLSYNYGLGTNDNGNVLGITNNKSTARNQAFTYDPLNRLLTAQSGSAWGINFTGGIDAWGNLAQTGTISGTSTNPMSVNQSVNGKNQFTLLGYSYDAAGNVLADGSGSTACAGNAYTWNAEEEMTCALGASYTYDGDGIRVKKTGGSATPTLYWGTGTLAESDTSGNLTSEYIFLGGKRIARRDVATGNVYYYFADELGSSNVVATAAGALENESDFYPFGGELPVTQNLTNQKYKFEGKERDPESASLAQPQGLDNFGARFDSSAMGRFMSPDWAAKAEPVPYAKMGDPQTLNLYAFTMNNPESAPDMDGHVMSLEQYHESLWSTGHPDQLGNDIDYTVEPGGDGSPGQIAPSASPGASCLGCSGTGIPAQQQTGSSVGEGLGGIVSTVKKWFGIGKTVKSVSEDGTDYDQWGKVYNSSTAALNRDQGSSKEAHPELIQVDKTRQDLASAHMQYDLVKAGMSAAGQAPNAFLGKLWESALPGLQTAIDQSQQRANDAWREYVSSLSPTD